MCFWPVCPSVGDSSVSDSTNIMLRKTIALVVSLTKLHNYCTEEADIASEATFGNSFSIRNNGSVRMVFSDDADMDLPEDLLYG
jgi:hypothetical protein